jgi:hypothetical protein
LGIIILFLIIEGYLAWKDGYFKEEQTYNICNPSSNCQKINISIPNISMTNKPPTNIPPINTSHLKLSG